MTRPGASLSDEEIALIGRRLLDRSLPKPDWTHAAHFAAVLWILRERPDIVAERDLPAVIRGYNEATGVANTDSGGYHATITLASIRVARALIMACSGQSLSATLETLLASSYGRSDWLLAYWSHTRLFSVPARRGWCAPDLQAFPF